MTDRLSPQSPKASPGTLRLAVQIFIEEAYGPSPPVQALNYLPPEGEFDVVEWLMSDIAERTPPWAPFEDVQSFALRIGCRHYRHMKLRISRPGKQPLFVFTADSHDVFLETEPGSPDYEGLIELKRRNAETVSRITAAWELAGLSTEKNYLREKIREARLSGRSR